MEKLISSGAGKVLARLVASGKATIDDFDQIIFFVKIFFS